jgi:NAD(P)-dependent dehydrogenase (short-subunit alcohol dehydrogenase family)
MADEEADPMTKRWTEADVPDQAGRVAVVTGANSGIGYDAARVLADHGATVVLACRSHEKATEAAARIEKLVPGANVSVVSLDLSDLSSIRLAAETIRSTHHHVDLLVNNAGVMVPPYGLTADGFELQFGTNHLGHFALTGLLLDLVMAAPGSRVVTVSSFAHRIGRIDFDDLQSEAHYRATRAYGQSKLANLLFTYELQRRLQVAGSTTIAVAAHPGASNTELGRHIAPAGLMKALGSVFSQSSSMGALPTLRAATDPTVRGGEYYGPRGLLEQRGYPKRVGSTARSRDLLVAERLWNVSEELTGVSYPLEGKRVAS